MKNRIDTLTAKIEEHAATAFAAHRCGDFETAKVEYHTELILRREQATEAIKAVNQALTENPEAYEAAYRELVKVGHQITRTLHDWREVGADIDDLCGLCGRSADELLAQMDIADIVGVEYSWIIAHYGLDAHGKAKNGKVLNADAPLTVALTEYIIDTLEYEAVI